MLVDVLRQSVGGALPVRLLQCRSPTLQHSLLPRLLDSPFHLADRVEVLIELVPVQGADAPPEVRRLLQDGIQHAVIAGFGATFPEEAVKGQGRIDLQRSGCGGRAPGDVGAVEHGVVLVDAGDRPFASQDQAGHLGPSPQALGQHLVDAGAGTNLSPGRQQRSGEQIAGLRAVDVSLQGFGVVESPQEVQLVPPGRQRLQHLAQLHGSPLGPGPPFPFVEAVAGEKAGETKRRLHA